MTAFMTTTSAAELLIPIWQRVLERPSVRVNDSFFELGGNPASAAQLFVQIAEVCGRQLPPVLIYSAPTVEALATLLEQPGPPRIPPLLLLKAGTEHPPIFIAPGLGDTVLDLFHLVDKIESSHPLSSHPIYGMQARGIDGVDEPCTSVEAMAQFHLEAIRQLQPRGPYFLIGYSLGGLVALEIAQGLCAAGEKVALLALVDSYPDRKQLDLIQRVRLSFRLVKRRLTSPYASAQLRRRSEILESCSNASQVTSSKVTSTGNIENRMRSSAVLALKRYRPKFYRGKINFVRAEISTDFPDDPIAVWSHLADQITVETIPGDHWSMLTTQFEKLGSVLTRHLEDTDIGAFTR
jgi:acetoacetyl-CoA synthetase